jgi:hypothetical protein
MTQGVGPEFKPQYQEKKDGVMRSHELFSGLALNHDSPDLSFPSS